MTRSTLAAVAVLLLLLARPAPAFHRLTPVLLQVTPVSGAGTIVNQQWGGIRFVVFDSDRDLLGSGSTGRQVYLFDLLERDLSKALGLHRLTDGLGDSHAGRPASAVSRSCATRSRAEPARVRSS